MERTKYLVNRILKMDYKEFFKTIDKVNQKTNKNISSIQILVININEKKFSKYKQVEFNNV